MRTHFALLCGLLVLVVASLSVVSLAPMPGVAAGPWYVAPGGSDDNSCASPGAPCATINGVIGKVSPGDTIQVAAGTYTGSGTAVVLLDKDATLSGGWDASFAMQSGTSVLNGESMRRSVFVSGGVRAALEHFSIQNGYADRGAGVYNEGALVLNNSIVTQNTAFVYQGGGVYNDGTLTLSSSVVSNNAGGDGGGIYSRGALTLNNSAIHANSALQHGGGICNDGTLIVNNSAINDNQALGYGGGISSNGTFTLTNSTVSNNRATSLTSLGGGIMNWGNRTAALYNSTVSGNSAGESGGGLYNSTIDATLTIRNSLIANNAAGNGPDCWGNVTSGGHNLLRDTSGCNLTPGAADLRDTNPKLGRLTGRPGAPLYHPLLPGSPAIDTGDPAGCKDGQGNGIAEDQRGASRVGHCDIGAYEYTTPGPAASVHALRGTPQHARPLSSFTELFQVSVLDTQGSPASSVSVTFHAPQSGPRGTFADTSASTTATSDLSGIATATMLTAGGLTGSYVVTATVDGVVSYASFLLTNTEGWYVAPGGDDSHGCLLRDGPCASINSALGRATPGDRIFVAQGVYIGTGRDEVLRILKDIVLSGGWDASFASQTGLSVVDGQGARAGIWVGNDANVVVERFVVHNAHSEDSSGAIANLATMTLRDSIVTGNTTHGIQNGRGCTITVTNSIISDNADAEGGGIWNEGGTFILNGSTVSGNRSSLRGGGIFSGGGLLILNNCTVSGNTGGAGGGVHNTGTLHVNNSTLYGNAAGGGGGIYNYSDAQATIRNSILAGNSAGSGPDCEGSMSSGGYSLIGDPSGCTFTPGAGDVTGLSPRLGALIGATSLPRYHPLLPGSPAIDAGDPAGCADHLGNPLGADQRGAARVGRCDIGAYEYAIPGPAASIHANGGTPLRTAPLSPFVTRLQAVVLDGIGSPVSHAIVSFLAPASGPSGAFADGGSYTVTIPTNEAGVALAPLLTANALTGSYTVTATVGGVVTGANFLLQNTGWYVSPDGDDNADCQSPASACATISGALAKKGFVQGDTILVASGTYTSTASIVASLNKDVVLSGGWSSGFSMQSGVSTIDGEGLRQGIVVNAGVTAMVERFAVRDGPPTSGAAYESSAVANEGILNLSHSTVSSNRFLGIANHGTMTVNNSTVTSNTHGIYNLEGPFVLVVNSSTISGNEGRGIINGATMTLNSSTVSDNVGTYFHGAIYNLGRLVVNNSTISGNSNGGITNQGLLALNNSTVSGNTNGGIVNEGALALNSCTITRDSGGWYDGGILGGGSVTLRNTMVAGNTAGRDCSCAINSAGYNLIGDTTGCSFTPGPGDLTNVDPRLWPFLIGSPGYHPLLPGSLAIDAGDPAGCTDSAGDPLAADQRGVSRVGRCDIGAYEYDRRYDPLSYVLLPLIERQ